MFFSKDDQKRIRDVESAVYKLKGEIHGIPEYDYFNYLTRLQYPQKTEPRGLSANVDSLKTRMTAVEEKLDLLLTHLGLQHVPSHDCPAKLISDGKDRK